MTLNTEEANFLHYTTIVCHKITNMLVPYKTLSKICPKAAVHMHNRLGEIENPSYCAITYQGPEGLENYFEDTEMLHDDFFKLSWWQRFTNRRFILGDVNEIKNYPSLLNLGWKGGKDSKFNTMVLLSRMYGCPEKNIFSEVKQLCNHNKWNREEDAVMLGNLDKILKSK